MKRKPAHLLATLACALSLALLFDLLFYQRTVGISFAIFIIALVTTLLVFARCYRVEIDTNMILLSIITIAPSALVATRASLILTTLNITMSVFLLLFLIMRLSGENQENFTLGNYLRSPLSYSVRSIPESFYLIKDLSDVRSEFMGSAMTKQIVKGLLITIPALIVFSLLFSAADLVFNKYITNAISFIKHLDFIGHALVISIVFSVVAGLLARSFDPRLPEILIDRYKVKLLARVLSLGVFGSALLFAAIAFLSFIAANIALLIIESLGVSVATQFSSSLLLVGPVVNAIAYIYIFFRYHQNEQSSPLQENLHTVPVCRFRYLQWVESTILLGSICGLFLLFVILQITYLFSGSDHIIAQGFTFAEYAHKGFFELLATAILSFALLWFISTRTIINGVAQTRILKLLSIALIGLTTVIMFSAFKRLDIYEAAYGYTVLRVYTQMFIILLGLIYTILLNKIVLNRSAHWLSTRIIATSILFVLCINFINPDHLIAQRNIARFKSTHKYELLVYNMSLSADAIDDVILSYKLLNANKNNPVSPNKSITLKEYRTSQNISSWLSFNFARDHEKQQLKLLEDD